MTPPRTVGVLLALGSALHFTCADEGMWLFTAPPREQLQAQYQFTLTDEWLAHLQQASVRFNSGGSGSFVSPDGLVMSNHHVGADALQKLGDEQHNYLRDGFHAQTLAEEKRCHDLELNVLVSIEDLTERVNAAVPAGAAPEAAFAARREVMAAIEQESLEQTGLRSDVVTLYQGGAYHLYRFKRFTDVRLVFAPEQAVAFFGGDPDNFEFPRYCLDVCFFRVYEDGKPAQVPHHLVWSPTGVAENELIFVSGHPGRTSRLLTVAELEYLRDFAYPRQLEYILRGEVLLTAYSARSEENARRAKDDLLGYQNSRKARQGGLEGLLDPRFFVAKRAAEEKLQAAAGARAELQEYAGAWDRIAAAQGRIRDVALEYRFLEQGLGFRCDLFDIARTLLRAADEQTKPDGRRLREFREAGRASLELDLFSTRPLYDDYEALRLADALTWMAGELGFGHELVQRVLAGQAPRQRAAALVRSTRLKDVAVRRQLYGGGAAAVAAAQDPLIELARGVDTAARTVREVVETQEEIKRQAHAQIARVRLAVEGTGGYPDATFTLRLAYGVAKGYEEAGRPVPFQTTMAGLYERWEAQGGREPFELPKRWLDRKRRLDLSTPFNFVNTADIIGGNSGSPVVNRAGELVGIIFDGNLASLVLDFYFTEEQARAVAVNSQAILEALRRVYRADRLADELVGKRRPS